MDELKENLLSEISKKKDKNGRIVRAAHWTLRSGQEKVVRMNFRAAEQKCFCLFSINSLRKVDYSFIPALTHWATVRCCKTRYEHSFSCPFRF